MKFTVELPVFSEMLPCAYPRNAVATDVQNWHWIGIDTVSSEMYAKSQKMKTIKEHKTFKPTK